MHFALKRIHNYLFNRSFSNDSGVYALTNCYIVVPTQTTLPRPISAGAKLFIDWLITRAGILAPGRSEVWAVHAPERRIWRMEDGQPISLNSLRHAEISVVVNCGFFMQPSPPFLRMVQEASTKTAALCAKRSSKDVYGFAYRSSQYSKEMLWSVLSYLVATVEEDIAENWDELAEYSLVAPDPFSEDNSPTLADVENRFAKRASDSPIYLNTALEELLDRPQDHEPMNGNPQRMAEVLLSHRQVSQVPWIFNSLINEIEYREGVVEVQSFPPEIHLSLTGACNIECRFCAYTKTNAIYQFVDLSKVAQLDFLRHVQILRLSSGLGEPTLNKHLPGIIHFLSERFPQLGLNFFTNAVALNRVGLIPALLGRVRWINVSLNAATAESWRRQCQDDYFERVCSNLRLLKDAKRGQGSLFPLIFGSMVLNRSNLKDLPLMPALCRDLGIDRFTAFPYSALGYHTAPHTFGAEDALEKCRAEYDAIYEATVQEALSHKVSLEIPLPSDQKKIRFGLEVRGFYDFAGIEKNEWQLGKIIESLRFSMPPGSFCHFLWRMACAGSTHKGNRAQQESNYLYPCIGPLSSLELSRTTAFRFPMEAGFLELWTNPVFRLLRTAQSQPGLCKVCDHCRKKDTRDPANFRVLEQLVAEFTSQVDQMTSPQERAKV